jgi:cytochrome c oxidase assembly protein subunit 15
MSPEPYNRTLHWIAVATALAAFPLVFLGALVTSHKAGMSVPDWPNSYGYNMFLFPPSKWVGGILYEHTHRLMGTVVGFLAVMLTLIAWGPSAKPTVRRWMVSGAVFSFGIAFVTCLIVVIMSAANIQREPKVKANTIQTCVTAVCLMLVFLVAWRCRNPEPRRHIRWLCTAVLIAVCLQGALGGLRVTLIELGLAVVHGCFAQAVFCLIGVTALMTSRRWGTLPDLRSVAGPGIARLAVAVVALVYLQLIVGAIMRHYNAGLAVPDVPLHYGQVLPPTDQAGLDAANLSRARSGSPDLLPTTLFKIWLHVGHRIGAVIVSTGLIVLAWRVLRRPGARAVLGRSVGLLLVLLSAQVTLGVLTVLLHKPADIASGHVAVGALLLLTTVLVTARLVKMFGLRAVAAEGVATGRVAADRQNSAAVRLGVPRASV